MYETLKPYLFSFVSMFGEKSSAYNYYNDNYSFLEGMGIFIFETGKRYVTRGVAVEIGLEIQLLLWAMIDRRKEKGIELDYMQIFELSVETKDDAIIQKIVHRQEVPEFKDVYYLPMIENPIDGKIWVIDSGEYSTMMFPSEY